jgi:NADH-quinone oxidoreductase subunit N
MNFHSLILLAPEIFLSVLAMIILIWEGFTPQVKRPYIYASVFGLLLAGVFIVPVFVVNVLPGAAQLGIFPRVQDLGWVQYDLVLNMLSVDSFSLFFKLILIISSILVLWISVDYFEFEKVSMGTYSAMILMTTVGMMFLVGSVDFLIAIIALELVSIPSFILTGFILGRRSCSEAAIKFFLVGTFSTGLLLFGISYFYGYFGSTSIIELRAFSDAGLVPDMPLRLLLVFLVAGFGFKLAMVPFHMWAPDAYEGAPTPITAFLSVGPKVATIGFLLRIFASHQQLGLTTILAILAAITMTVGNLGALKQMNMKRLMAYSSIAHVGYILVALVAGGRWGVEAAMLYVFVYLFMNLGVFAIHIMVSNKSKDDNITAFAGLSKSSLGLAVSLAIFLLALTGIPPLAGFIGKFYVFAAAIKQSPHLLWLVILAVLNSVVSLYYYFRIAQQAFFRDPLDPAGQPLVSPSLLSCLWVAAGATVLLGLFPNGLVHWVQRILGS